MKALNYILVVLLLVGAGCAVGYNVGSRTVPETLAEAKPDTVFVHDTFIIDRPILKERNVVERIYVPVNDTTVINDTVYLALPRESRTYGDERFTAVVSGYKPSLDRLEIYLENQVVTKYLIPEPKKPKMNTLSVGMEASYMGSFCLPARVKYTRNVKSWFAVYGYGQYDLLSKRFGGGAGGEFKLNW